MTKRVLVTGANKGIGLAVVERILREQGDAEVLLGARDAARGEAARQALLAKDGAWAPRLAVLRLDVTDAASVADAAAEARARFAAPRASVAARSLGAARTRSAARSAAHSLGTRALATSPRLAQHAALPFAASHKRPT